MRDLEEINRLNNQYAIWTRGYGIYEHSFPPEDPDEWEPRFNAKWENLKRYGHSKGDFRTNGPGAAADESVHSGPVSADSHPEATEKTGPDTPAERGGDA